MKRLRDDASSPDPHVAESARALGALRPRKPDAAAFRRVEKALRNSPPSPHPWHAAGGVGIGVGVGAVAVAVLLTWWYLHRARAVAPPDIRTPSSRSQTEVVPAAPPREAPQTETPTAPPTIGVVAVVSGNPPPPPAKKHAHKFAEPVASAPLPPPLAALDPPASFAAPDPVEAVRTAKQAPIEAELVMTAANALRRDHEAARATLLLNYYLAHYPHGALVEEALVFAIEAARDQHDGRAGALAEHYLAAFPQGRYRTAVLDSLRQQSPNGP